MLFVFGFGAIILSANPARAEALTSVTVAPKTDNVDNLVGQADATWRFTINNVTALTALTHAVEITFPSIGQTMWDFSLVTASSTALGGDALQFATSSQQMWRNGNQRKIILVATSTQTTAANNFIIDIKGLTNPMIGTSDMGSKNWSVRTCVLAVPGVPGNGDTGGCASDLDSAATGAATITRRGGAITDWTITPTSFSSSATMVQYSVTFTASTTLNVGDKIHFNFPAVGYASPLTGATTSLQTIVEGGTAQIAADAIAVSNANGTNQIILTVSGGEIDPAATSTVTFTVGNITNPTKGAYQGFKVYTTIAGGGLVDGSYWGEPAMGDNSPPPVETIQIGGDNTVTGTVKVRRANGDLETVTQAEARQLQVGMGCPDLQFFAGTVKVADNGTFTYSNLISATYILFVMPFSSTNSEFFANYIPPSQLQINATGAETITVTPTFEVPDAEIRGTITGGIENGTEQISVRGYTGAVQSFSPVFNGPDYLTEGLSATGTGYFKLPVKSGDTWQIAIEANNGTISSGGTQYWTPAVDPVFISAGTAITTLSPVAFAVADKTLNVTLRRSSDNSVIDETTPPMPCLGIRRSGSDMKGPGGQGVCSTTLVNGVKVYQLKVPTGAFSIQLMMPGGFKEYPVNILSTDTTVNKTVVVQQATTYITGTIHDPEGFHINGASVMAQGSNGSFNQTLTNTSGVYTLYVPVGTYRVEAFAPGYGPLGAITDISVLLGANATGKDFTISAGNFKTIKGQVHTGATNYEGVHMHAFGSSGQNSTMTRSDGTYTLRVPAGTGYTIDAWSESMGFIGSLTNVDVSGNVTGKDFTPQAQGYLQIKITGGNTYGLDKIFAWAFNPTTGKGNGSDTWTATTSNADLVTKFNLPAGDYRLDVGTPAFGNLTSLAANIDATTTTIVADATSEITIALPEIITLSGVTRANATVWASRTDGPGKFTTTADATTGAYSMKIPSGYNYMVGANLTGYTSAPVTLSAVAVDTTQNLTLTASSDTISGTVTSGGEALSEGFVWAVRANNTGWMGSELSGDGTYSLAVDSGSWTVYADAPCKTPSSGTAQTGAGTVNISLTAISGCSYNAPEMNSMTPTTGGVVSQSDVSVNIPPNALGTGSSNVSMTVAKPSIIPPSTLNASPIGTSTKRILVTDSNGTAVTSLSNSIEISITYSDSDIPAGSENNLQLAFWNTSSNTWDPVAATLDTTNNTLTAKVDHLTDFAPIVPTADNAPETPTGLTAAKSGNTTIDLSWTAVSGATSYLIYKDTSASGSFPYLASGTGTTYSSTGLSGGTAYYYKVSASNSSGESTASDAATATTCSTVANGTVSGAGCTLTCNSGYTNSGGTCVAASSGGGIMPSGNSNQTPADTAAEETPAAALESPAESPAKTTTASELTATAAQKIVAMAAEAAEIIKSDINSFLGKFGFKRDLAKEDVAVKKYVKDLIKGAKGITAEKQNALSNFIAYGTYTTVKLGEGERAGVINSYKSTFGKLPATAEEWSDVIKIANGRWPTARDNKSENASTEAFKKIYKRSPNRANANDDAAVTVIAYGLRPANRNTNSEKAAIKSFKAIYGYAPVSATAWDIVRAIAYSGAKR
ncbi:MAG: carboxypeptidase regulatory-like domain-containing protein [Patescibacteria group bacterium]